MASKRKHEHESAEMVKAIKLQNFSKAQHDDVIVFSTENMAEQVFSLPLKVINYMIKQIFAKPAVRVNGKWKFRHRMWLKLVHLCKWFFYSKSYYPFSSADLINNNWYVNGENGPLENMKIVWVCDQLIINDGSFYVDSYALSDLLHHVGIFDAVDVTVIDQIITMEEVAKIRSLHVAYKNCTFIKDDETPAACYDLFNHLYKDVKILVVNFGHREGLFHYWDVDGRNGIIEDIDIKVAKALERMKSLESILFKKWPKDVPFDAVVKYGKESGIKCSIELSII
uniref:Uncharacterized protein n=1 Tax=Panagrolaimus sp. ES5 TaxID=591445 RepID=A0AC34GAC4_9BILA